VVNDDPRDECCHDAKNDQDADDLDDAVAPFLLGAPPGGLAHGSTLPPLWLDFDHCPFGRRPSDRGSDETDPTLVEVFLVTQGTAQTLPYAGPHADATRTLVSLARTVMKPVCA
jgi:hypothetical protein